MMGTLLRPLGLFPGQELLLMQLWEQDGCSQVDLVRRLGLDPSTVTKMLQRLERDGLLTREACPEDGRVLLVCLTEPGRGLQQEVTRLWTELEHATTGALDASERLALLEMLAKLEPQDNPRAGASG
jgi:DNA-binding MarR family transcriptional regulator